MMIDTSIIQDRRIEISNIMLDILSLVLFNLLKIMFVFFSLFLRAWGFLTKRLIDNLINISLLRPCLPGGDMVVPWFRACTVLELAYMK